MQNIDNHNLELFEQLCSEYLSLTFKGKHCNEHKSIKVHYNPRTGYWLKNFNPANGLPDNINNWGLYNKYHKKQSSPQRPLPKTPKKKKPQPPKGQPQNADPKYCPLSHYGHILKHFKIKTGATPQFLQKYGIRGIKKLYGINWGSCVAYSAKGGTKFKRPFAEARNKYRTVKNKGIEYCFGFSQLPDHCETILIVGGEDDALCINYNLNKYGIYAVALWSESIAPSIELINKLKEKSERVLFMYDADKAGVQNSKKFSAQLGVPYVNSEFLYSHLGVHSAHKDICDIYHGYGKEGAIAVRATVLKALEMVGYISKDIDPFSIEVQNVLRCNFTQYMSEKLPREFLIDALAYYERIIVQAPAGSGKSYNTAGLAQSLKDYCRGVIIAAPTVAICEQLTNTIKELFENSTDSCTGLWGSIDHADIESAKSSTVIVATYDKLHKLSDHVKLEDYTLCIDEFHQIVNDLSYRNKAMQSIFSFIKKAKYCMLMSATPNLMFTREDVHPLFNFTLCQFLPEVTNEIEVQPIVHTKTRNEILGAINDFKPENTKGVHCIKFDNNNSLEAFCKHTRTNLTANNIEHLTSQDESKRELNKTYKEIMQTGSLARPLEHLVYTTLLEAGVSFKFEVGCVSLLDVNSHSRFGQLSTRPRLQKDNTNKLVRVNWFLKDKEKQKEYKASAVAQFKAMFIKAEKHANDLNNCKNVSHQKKQIKKASTDIQLWVSENENGVYEVNILGILHELYKRECETCTPEMMQLRVQRLDPRYSFRNVINTAHEEQALKELISEVKEANEECNNSFNELLQKEPENVLKAVYTKSKNSELRDLIRTVLGVSGIHRETMIDYIEEHKECFKTRLHHKVARGVCSLVEVGHNLNSAIEVYTNEGARGVRLQLDLHTIHKRKRAKKRGIISSYDAKQLRIYEGVKDTFKNIAKNMQSGRRKSPLTRLEIFNKISETLSRLDIPKKLSQKQAVEYFERCFEVDRKRTKKGVKFMIKGVAVPEV